MVNQARGRPLERACALLWRPVKAGGSVGNRKNRIV